MQVAPTEELTKVYNEKTKKTAKKEVDIDFLVPHEKVLLDKKDILKNNLRYKNDYIIISTIIVCSESNLIIDGHHRYTALKELGYNKIPVTIINYFSNHVSG